MQRPRDKRASCLPGGVGTGHGEGQREKRSRAGGCAAARDQVSGSAPPHRRLRFLPLTPEDRTTSTVCRLKTRPSGSVQRPSFRPVTVADSHRCPVGAEKQSWERLRAPLPSGTSWAGTEPVKEPQPQWRLVAVPEKRELGPHSGQPLRLLITKALEGCCVMSKSVCSGSSSSRLPGQRHLL